MRLAALLCTLSVAFVNGTSLSWPKTYSYEAILYVPESDITIPYKVWSDGDSGNARVDFYNGLDKLYRRRLYGASQNFVYFKINPELKATGIMEVCHKLRPEDDTMLEAYSSNTYLPNYDFNYMGSEQLNGCDCQKWRYVTTTEISGFKVISDHTIWVTYKVVGEEVATMPVRYKHYSTVGNVTLDQYTHKYISFNFTDIDQAIFELPDELPCTDEILQYEDEYYDPISEYMNPFYEHHKVTRAFDRIPTRELLTDSHSSKPVVSTFSESFEDRNGFINDEKLHNYDVTVGEDGTRMADDAHFDWRDFGAVSEVKVQTSMCSSSYAFAAASAVESALFLSGKRKRISEQAIIDCSWSAKGNFGCRGGNLKTTLDWLQQHGAPYEDGYGRYLAMEGLCNAANMTNVRLNKYTRIKKDVNSIKRVLRKRGPLLLSVDGSQTSFRYYSKGIYDDKNCNRINITRRHALLLVGYGRENGSNYWIMKNSYGRRWGEQGYIRMAMRNNTCGIMDDVYWLQLRA